MIGACPAERLRVLEVPADVGLPYRESDWLPHEYALHHHSYATERVILLLVPEVDYRQKVTAIVARRYDVQAERWLAPARFELAGPRGLGPRYADLHSGPLGADYALSWSSELHQTRQGVVFGSASGAFRVATRAELAAIPAYDGRSRDAASPPDPEPTSGVSIKAETLARRATLRRGATTLGTVLFPSLPGSYVGVFQTTRSALFWHNGAQREQQRLPLEQQRHSYLLNLETGATCQIARDLAYPGTVMFRQPTWLGFVNAVRNDPPGSDCPPGAPCAAPEQSHFIAAQLVILKDLG